MTQRNMKRFYLVIASTFLICTAAFGQKWNPETICSTDTLIVEPTTKIIHEKKDSINQKPYKIVQCRTRSNVGYRIDIAVSRYYYGDRTRSWIGQHGGP